MTIIFENQSTPVGEGQEITDVRATPYRAIEVNLRDALGAEYKTTNPLPVKTPAPSGGPGSAVTLYDPFGVPIHVTTEGVGQALDTHLTNTTIEQNTGTATNNKNIQAGFVDETGALRPPIVDSITRRTQVDLRKSLTTPAPAAASVGVASAQILASNANRKGAAFVNTSVNTISFGIAQTAVLNSGITLGPLGT